MPLTINESSASGLSKELIAADATLSTYVWVDAARMHGEPCFFGTRVPVKHLFDHLHAGDSLQDFLDGFPDVSRTSAIAVIDLAAAGLLERLHRR